VHSMRRETPVALGSVGGRLADGVALVLSKAVEQVLILQGGRWVGEGAIRGMAR
jgi:hypothetical protein